MMINIFFKDKAEMHDFFQKLNRSRFGLEYEVHLTSTKVIIVSDEFYEYILGFVNCYTLVRNN